MEYNHIIHRTSVWPLFNTIILGMGLCFGTLGYFQVEALTSLFADDIGNTAMFCESKVRSPLKYYKITYYNKSKGDLRLYCITNNPQDNLELVLNKRSSADQWQVVVINNLNSDKALYWPVYT